MTRISIIGAGSWGIALAKLLYVNGNKIVVWSALEDEIEMLQTQREHKTKLPGVILPEDMEFTTDLAYTIKNAEILVMAVPSTFVRSTAAKMKPYVKEGQIVVNVAKGIEESTLSTLSSVIESELSVVNVAVLSGPSHAEEVGKQVPTTIVVGSKDKATAEMLQNIFMNEVFRVYTSPDVIGIEIGAALKNVVALAAGIADGLGYGDNTKAALITRGMAEITRLGIVMGGKKETFYGLSGIGDLIVTCASVHSRNRKAGMLIGQGYTMQEAMDEVKMVVEGVYSAKAALKLSQKYQISMPIVEKVNEILFENKPADAAVNELMLRDKKIEIDSGAWNH